MDGSMIISIGKYDPYAAVGILLVAALLSWILIDIKR